MSNNIILWAMCIQPLAGPICIAAVSIQMPFATYQLITIRISTSYNHRKGPDMRAAVSL